MQVEHGVGFDDAEALGAVSDFGDFVAGGDFAFFQDTKIKTGAMVGDEERGHLRLVHADADAIAFDAGPGDFEKSGAEAETVADADLSVGRTVDG